MEYFPNKTTMPMCPDCGGALNPFGDIAKRYDDLKLVECYDCHARCNDTYFRRMSHRKKCPKRPSFTECYCMFGPVEPLITKKNDNPHTV